MFYYGLGRGSQSCEIDADVMIKATQADGGV